MPYGSCCLRFASPLWRLALENYISLQPLRAAGFVQGGVYSSGFFGLLAALPIGPHRGRSRVVDWSVRNNKPRLKSVNGGGWRRRAGRPLDGGKEEAAGDDGASGGFLYPCSVVTVLAPSSLAGLLLPDGRRGPTRDPVLRARISVTRVGRTRLGNEGPKQVGPLGPPEPVGVGRNAPELRGAGGVGSELGTELAVLKRSAPWWCQRGPLGSVIDCSFAAAAQSLQEFVSPVWSEG